MAMKVALRILLCLVLMMGLGAEMALAAKKKKAKRPAAPDDTMTVVVMRSAFKKCEPNCPMWIFADGRITSGTPSRFRKVLKQMGDRHLPVLLRSPGGDVNAAMEIGRLIMARKLDTIVADAQFAACGPRDKSCEFGKAKAPVYPGYSDISRSYCNSACTLILAGAKRVSAPNASIGLHQIQTTWYRDRQRILETYRVVRGKKKVVSRKVVSSKRTTWTSTKLPKGFRGKLVTYFKATGISQQILDYMDKAPPDRLYFANPTELVALRLVNDTGKVSAYVGDDICGKSPPAGNCGAAAAR
jgi:hypothetical protein